VDEIRGGFSRLFGALCSALEFSEKLQTAWRSCLAATAEAKVEMKYRGGGWLLLSENRPDCVDYQSHRRPGTDDRSHVTHDK
jgi:hypothetical protein